MWGPLFSSEWKQDESYTVHNHSWCDWKAKNCPWSTERWPCHYRVWYKNEEVSRSLPTVVCIHVITLLDFPPSPSEEETTIKSCLLEFLQKAEAKMLQVFLVFTTGAPCLPIFGYGKIDVKFGSDPLICLESLTFPIKPHFRHQLRPVGTLLGDPPIAFDFQGETCVWFSRRIFGVQLETGTLLFFIRTLHSNQTIVIIVMLL